MILLTPKWNEYDSPFDEYLLLELYTPSGINKYHASSLNDLGKIGIRLWYVDARLIYSYDGDSLLKKSKVAEKTLLLLLH